MADLHEAKAEEFDKSLNNEIVNQNTIYKTTNYSLTTRSDSPKKEISINEYNFTEKKLNSFKMKETKIKKLSKRFSAPTAFKHETIDEFTNNSDDISINSIDSPKEVELETNAKLLDDTNDDDSDLDSNRNQYEEGNF